MTCATIRLAVVAVVSTGALILANAQALEASKAPSVQKPRNGASDWPQWRGPNRDGFADNSPKLRDQWQKEGPRLLWKSDWIPGYEEGGCGSPVVVDGKVFLYVDWKQPVGGGKAYHLITTKFLVDAGWNPDLGTDLAKKIEEGWASPKRPSSLGWPWWSFDEPTEKQLDEFLAKHPELNKYISDFLATLAPADAAKFGPYIKRRLCIAKESKWGEMGPDQGFTWDELTRLSKLQNAAYPSYQEWLKVLGQTVTSPNHSVYYKAWAQSFTMADTIVCLDAATGKELWKQSFPHESAAVMKNDACWNFHQGYFGLFGGCGTPAIWGGKCYAGGAAGLYCLSAKDGKLLWQVKTEPAHASPLVADGVVYHCGYAYNADNGKPLWKNPLWQDAHRRDEFAKYGCPLLWTSGGKDYVVTTDGVATSCCLDWKTGKVMWTLKRTRAVVNDFQPCFIQGDLLVADGMSYKMTPTAITPLVRLANGLSLFYNNYLYAVVDNGDCQRASLSCADLKTGELKWTNRCPVGDGDFSMPILADGKLYLTLGSAHGAGRWGSDWSVEMVKADPNAKYVQLGIFNPQTLCPYSSPAIAGGRLYLRLINCVACYDLR